MPSSWTQNYYHAVFGTKDRLPLIAPEIEIRLYPFLGGILSDLGCTPIAINGMPDHVHILTRYPSDLSHSDMLRHLKGRSSKWINDIFPSIRFAWQDGYGGFTVSKTAVPAVERYIRNQKAHHGSISFQQECDDMMRRAGLEPDSNGVP